MTNPYEETYETLVRTLQGDPELGALAEFVPVDLDDADNLGVSRRNLDDGDKLRLAVIPRGGNVVLISSTSSEVREEYRVEAVGGAISLRLLWKLKWALLRSLWSQQTLDLDYITGLDVLLVSDEPMIGTKAVKQGTGDSVSWKLAILIRITMVFNRTDLPVG